MIFVKHTCNLWTSKGCFSNITLKSLHQLWSFCTCDHAVSGGNALQHQLNKPHVCACLQVTDALLEDGSEDAPDLGLTVGLALVQQLHHAHYAFRFLDDEVHL